MDPGKKVEMTEGHAYAIIDMQELENGRVKLIQLQNPTGEADWTGD